MTVERNKEREFGVYNVTNNKFHNLNYSNPFEEAEEFEQTPIALFTYEECERYIVHMQDKTILTILNLKQPKYLFEFSLEVIKKEYYEKAKKKAISHVPTFENVHQYTDRKNVIESNKLGYMQALAKWDNLLNSHEVQLKGRMPQVQQQKPKYTDFGLTFENFNTLEKTKLKSSYNIVI